MGEHGTIIYTTDLGVTWQQQNSSTINTLYSLSFVNSSTGNVVGEAGTILRTITGGTTYVKESNAVDLPEEFELFQNYPNPFNSYTKISWQSPASSQVTLKIYNILGRVVATLINDYRRAGKYETEFNAEAMPSGVYFYRYNQVVLYKLRR